jgi:hypothetical protein
MKYVNRVICVLFGHKFRECPDMCIRCNRTLRELL